MLKIKKIKNTENYYIGEDGSVYRKLKPQKLSNGYMDISLGREKKHNLVHRIVADTFLQKQKGKNIVNHKNGIRHDNRVENLEWCTTSENLNHSYKNTNNSPIKNFTNCSLYFKDELIGNFKSIKEAIRFAVKKFDVSFTMLEKHKKHKDCRIEVRCNDYLERE